MSSQLLHIGTSGWSYPHWTGIFYPADLKPEKYLEFYTERFECVELNASFYHLPLRTTVEGWVRRTPGTFRFCPKMNRSVTHYLHLKNAEEQLKGFFGIFEGMKERMGPVLIQLHPGLTFESSIFTDFLDILKENYRGYRFAVEVRNKSWMNDVFFEMLSGNNMAFVIADSGKRYPYAETITADFVYLRFHGREQLYASDYSESELYEYAGKIKTWQDEDKEIWAFFNNDYHGYAPHNAERLIEIMQMKII